MSSKNRFFEFIELQYTSLNNQINSWLENIYNKSNIQFNSASPYGQILNVQKELFSHNIIYLKQSLENINIQFSEDERTIRYIARIAGHNPSRSIAASGVLKFKVKAGVNIAEELGTSDTSVIIQNNTKIKNNTNTLTYSIDLGNTDNVKYTLSNLSEFYLNIVQGSWEEETFTGDGSEGQSFSVNINNNAKIDNFNYNVYYNGQILKKVTHQWDMLPNEMSCVTKTGFNGGIDIYFGNGDYGFIPEPTSIITVKYLLNNGVAGEILNPLLNDWKFEDDVKSGQGETIKMEDLFDISIYYNVGFASNGETVENTKKLIPIVSRNFVLSTPDQFKYHLSKLNIFSQVDAYNKLADNDYSSTVTNNSLQNKLNKLKTNINNNKTKTELINQINSIIDDYGKLVNNTNDNVIYLFLIPKIRKYLNNSINYFNLPLDVFYLDDYEKTKIKNYLTSQAIMSITSEVKIEQPIITKYICNVFVNRFEDTNEDNIRSQIVSLLSDYFLDNQRTDRIPRSEIISLLKSIDGIDSIDVDFLSQKNEDYHKTGSLQNNYDENLVLGIDTTYGDIIMGKNEYALIRGGWRDRDNNYYDDNIKTNGLSSINITFGQKLIKR
jgi:hypothetical protein